METSIQMSGLRELRRRLDRIDANMERRILKNCLTPAAKVLRDAWKAAAPKGPTGNLKKSIRISEVTTGKSPRRFAALKVGPGKSKTHPGYHAHLVEFGTKAHEIVAGTRRGSSTGKKVLYFGGRFHGPVVRHKGARARPFLFPTWRAKKPEVLALIRGVATEEIKLAWGRA